MMRTKLRRLKKEWRNPILWRNAAVKYVLLPIFYFHNDGTSILDEKWDHLIILDACRYDSFKKIIKKFELEGVLEYRISRGCDTEEFILENFKKKNKKMKKIIYITGNPGVSLLLEEKNFYKIIHVWKDGWSEKYNTVLPQKMYEYVLKTYYSYPGKRLIIHFMQPHFPYISNPNIGAKEIKIALYKAKFLEKKWKNEPQERNFFDIVPYNFYLELPIRRHIKYYEKNLEIAIKWIKKMLKFLRGRIVITSDHGEAFGERFLFFRVYGHIGRMRIPVLKIVPWFIIEK